MKILSNEEIRFIEQKTLENQDITSLDLVERVSAEIAAEVKALCRREQPLLVLAGWGNNGADALDTARLLALDGYQPVVYLFNIGGNSLNTECKVMRDRLSSTPGVTLHEITGGQPFQWPEPSADTVIIDGLFGSGLNRPMPRSFQMLARNINQSGATVVAIDIPSGLMADWNGSASREDMMHADLTLAVEYPRLAFMLGDNADVVGHWKTVRIGLDKQAERQAPFSFVLVDRQTVAQFLAPRKDFSSKADYGNAILFAGSRGMIGAAILAARAALRSGAGKVTVHSGSDGCPIVQTAVPSAMFRDDRCPTHITEMPFEPRYNAIAVGPGIGTRDDTAVALEKLVKAASAAGRRLVLDADALNIIAQHPILLNYLTPLSVITPHAGEFDRIFGESTTDEERLRKAIKCAEDYSLIIVLKGHHTAIVRPDGKVMFNSSGTPALATPGSGDVLTGIIAALMAQGLQSEIAAFVGPYIHGVAGEIAARFHGDYGVTAEDIANNVGAAINEIMS